MGSYNSEYESYYNSLKKDRRGTYKPSYNKGFEFNNFKGTDKSYWIRRIMRDLTGVFILFVFVIVCKIIVTPKTQVVYNFSKNVLNQSYDYKELEKKAQSVDLKNIQDNIIKFIDQVRSKVTGKETVENKIKKEFALPAEGVETSQFGYEENPITKKKFLMKA